MHATFVIFVVRFSFLLCFVNCGAFLLIFGPVGVPLPPSSRDRPGEGVTFRVGAVPLASQGHEEFREISGKSIFSDFGSFLGPFWGRFLVPKPVSSGDRPGEGVAFGVGAVPRPEQGPE